MVEKFDRFQFLKSILSISNSNIPIEEKINQVLQSISNSFSSECQLIRTEEIKEGGFLYNLKKQRKPFLVDDKSILNAEEFLPLERSLIKPTFGFFPVFNGSQFYGILYIGFSKKMKFSSEITDLINIVLKEIEKNLKIENLSQRTERYLSELSAFYEIGKAITSTIKLDELMKLIVVTGQKILKAKGGILRLKEQESGELKIQYISGDFNPNPLEEIISRRVFYTSVPQSINHLIEDKPCFSILCVPLIRGNEGVLGTLAYFDNGSETSGFNERDIQLLVSIGEHISRAIENAYLYKSLEKLTQGLKEAQDLLLHREKITALGEFANSIAHEIKNPLASIGGFARRLDRLLTEGEPEKRYVETIIKEVARLERVLNNFLDYAHRELNGFQECDIEEILEESLSMFPLEMNNNDIKIIKEFDDGLPKLKGDKEQLKHAFFHVIQNAFQAMQGEGNLFLRAISLLKNGSNILRIEVEDTGGGIKPEDIHHIFNPFYTNRESGLGLGLSIVHKIVTSHHGRIEVENHPGKGVNFIIYLPCL